MIINIPMYGQMPNGYQKSLEFSELVNEKLYHSALAWAIQTIERQSGEFHLHTPEISREIIISYLKTRSPELAYQLSQADRSITRDQQLSQLITDLVREESTMGLFGSESEMETYAKNLGLNKKDRAALAFFSGYELFKSKKFAQALNVFEKAARSRTGEYEYACYYGGLSALMTGKVDKAYELLIQVRRHEVLTLHTPYYLASILYVQKQEERLIRTFAPRVDNPRINNVQGLRKLVGLAYFNLGEYKKAKNEIEQLPPSERRDIEMTLAISYWKTGESTLAINTTKGLAKSGGALNNEENFLLAMILNDSGEKGEAIKIFRLLYDNPGRLNKETITWNLAVLSAATSDYQSAAQFSAELLTTTHSKEANKILEGAIGQLEEDESALVSTIQNIKGKSNDASAATNVLYRKALRSLKQSDEKEALKYFNLLEEINANSTVVTTIPGWKGIMAYKSEEYNEAIRQFSFYLKNKRESSPSSKLFFDVHYFMAYAQFKEKNHKSALGYFSQAIGLLNENSFPLTTHESKILSEDVLVRLGDTYFLIDDYASSNKCYAKAEEIKGYQMDYILFQRSVIAELLRQPYDQLLILDQLLSEHPESKFTYRAKFDKATALFQLERYQDASQVYTSLLKTNTPIEIREQSRSQLGLINANIGNYDEAINHYKTLVASTTDSDKRRSAENALKEIYADYVFDTEAYLELAISNPTSEGIAKSPDSILFQLAADNYQKENFSVAYEQFEQLVANFPESQLNASARLKAAEILHRSGRIKAASESYLSIGTSTRDAQIRQTAFTAYEEITFGELKDYESFKSYAIAHFDGLRAEALQFFIEACIETQDHPERLTQAAIALANTSISTNLKERSLAKVVHYMASHRYWVDLSNLLGQEGQLDALFNQPKYIYYGALSMMNADRLVDATSRITDNYPTLLEDVAWMAKSIILLSDIYVIQDKKDSAKAALEAMLKSKGEIPDSLKRQAENRLSNLKEEPASQPNIQD